jgi:hypothetical protein
MNWLIRERCVGVSFRNFVAALSLTRHTCSIASPERDSFDPLVGVPIMGVIMRTPTKIK